MGFSGRILLVLPGFDEVYTGVLFDGVPGDGLVVELMGEELDQLSANDMLDHYRREFTGDYTQWVGHYEPVDEGSTDPENMPKWRVCYDIMKVD